MKKALKIALGAAATVCAVVFAVRIEPLEEHLAAEMAAKFKPEEVADWHWEHDRARLQDEALGIGELLDGLKADPQAFCDAHARVLGIGSGSFFVVKGTLEEFTSDGEYLSGNCEGSLVRIPVKYIFGNLARDASGWFNLDDFQNTMAFNEISSYLNSRILSDVIPSEIPQGGSCSFCGAVEVKPAEAIPASFRVIPYLLEFHD